MAENRHLQEGAGEEAQQPEAEDCLGNPAEEVSPRPDGNMPHQAHDLRENRKSAHGADEGDDGELLHKRGGGPGGALTAQGDFQNPLQQAGEQRPGKGRRGGKKSGGSPKDPEAGKHNG